MRHRAFWSMEPCDRPLTRFMLPPRPATGEDEYLEALRRNDLARYWSDPEILLLRAKRSLARQHICGDDLPVLNPPFGPSMLSAFLGAKVEFADNTVWFHPCTDDLADLKDLQFDPNNHWWRIVKEYCSLASQEPNVFQGILDLGGLGDNLAALIGSEVLMIEMAERPDLVKAVLRRMLDIVKTCYQEIYAILERPGKGTVNGFGIWSPGRTGVLQNDMSIMLSTDMYRDFFYDEFRELCVFFDRSFFHLDGARSEQHLSEFLLKVPDLDGTQVTGDPGSTAMQRLPALQLVQRAEKRIFVYVFPDEMEALFAELSPRGVCVITSMPTEQEANDFLHRMTRVCRAANRTADQTA